MKNKNSSKIAIVFEIILIIISVGYFIYSLIFIKDSQLFNIINSFLLVFFAVMLLLNQLTNKSYYKIISIIVVIGFALCNVLNSVSAFTKNIISLGNFSNKNINDVLVWAKENNIEIEQIYEYSDNIKEFFIISQDIDSNTPLKDVTKLKLIVSSGPNYNKEVIIPNLVGSKIDDLLKIKNELLLNNIEINYVKSDLEKDTIIEQSLKGQYQRNAKITFTISLGNEVIEEITMIDLVDKNIFDASLWLKQNGINFDVIYEFSDKTKGTVINQSIKTNDVIKIVNDKVSITVSKGQSITVPNLLNMSSNDVINWISENNLKIEFNEIYHTTVPLGNIISANYNEGDIIEDGTLIKITTSKGQIKFPKVDSLQDLRNWANGYNLEVEEQYATNNDVGVGGIISASYNEGDVVDPNTPISVTISTGRPITVPNFYNMSKNDINYKCQSLGLICSFYEGGYSNIQSGNAISQNVSAGATVTKGKTISIALSKGPAKTFTLKLPQATISSCIGDASCTINKLKSYLDNNYPGVSFTFETASSSTFNNAGFIHENSGKVNGTVTDGSIVTQGNTYKIIITK